MEIRYSYRDAPTIKAFSQSDAFVRGLMGPFRSGKSSGCIVEIIRRAQAHKPMADGIRRTRWLVVRNTYGQLNDTTIKTFHQWFPPHLFGEWKVSDHTYVIKAFEKTEIEILFRALDRPDHVSNLLSLEVTGAYVNEAREVPWSIIEALQGRVGQYPSRMQGGCTWSGVFMDTNPPDNDSRWYRFFEEQDHPPSFAQLFKQPSGLNEAAENLTHLNGGRVYYERLAQGKSDEWKKVYIHGEYGFVIDGKPVFPEYADTIHCQEVFTSEKLPVYRGWDFGLTPAVAFCQMTSLGQFIIVDELVSENMGVDTFSDAVIQHSSEHFPGTDFIDIGDPAGQARAQTDERTCFQILEAKDIAIEPGLQSLTIRLESMRKPLTTLRNGQPGFALHSRCRVLRKGFQGGYAYRRLQTTAERYTAEPDKNRFSHVMDGACYVATRIFGEGLTMKPPRDEDDEFAFSSLDRSPITGY